MSDKLRQTVAVAPNFVGGEAPTAAKLDSIGAQLQRAAVEFEKAIGDIHGTSWPYSPNTDTRLSLAHGRARTAAGPLTNAEERALDIANLARLIGPSSNINPRTLGANKSITESVPVGVHEFSLRWPVGGTVDASNPSFTDTTVFNTYVADPADLTSGGDYSVDADGHVYCVTASAGNTVTYVTQPSNYNGGLSPQHSRFNVYPDPNQITAGGTGLSFGAKDGQGRYPVTLPTITHQQSNIEGNSIALDDDDPNYNEQLFLPKVLVDNFLTGEEIPSGFMFLKNYTTNEVYEDGVYYYSSTTAFLIGNVDLDDDIAAGHDFVLVTVGTDITTNIDDLRIKSFHAHDRTHGEPFVNKNDVIGWTQESGNSGIFIPSEIPGNFAPQYLHRDGWNRNTTIDGGLNDENCMRGDLMFGAEAGTAAGEYAAGIDTGQTHGIYFGTGDVLTTACYINRTNEDMFFRNGGGDARGFSFNGTNAGGGGVEFNSGYRGSIGDETNLIQCWAYEGLTNDVSSGEALVRLTDEGFPADVEVYGYTLLMDLNGGGSDLWWPPGSGGTVDFSVSYDISTTDFLYVPLSVGGASGGVVFRMVVWYRIP
jgi:hypothetical protein